MYYYIARYLPLPALLYHIYTTTISNNGTVHPPLSSQCEGDSSITGSFTPEEEEDFFSLSHSRMTRLDPSSHRNNARTWMEEARNRDSFARRSSVPHGKEPIIILISVMYVYFN